MNLDQLYRYIHFIATKENSGMTYTVDQFNLNLPIVVQEMYNLLIREYEQTHVMSEALSVYKVVMGDQDSPLIIATTGHASKPDDYQHFSSAHYIYNSTYRPIEYLTDGQYMFRKSSSLRPPSYEYPIVTERSTYFEFLPKDLSEVEFTYLRNPENPFYDYYYDLNGDIIYLPPETNHLLQIGEEGRNGETTSSVFTDGLLSDSFPATPVIGQMHKFLDGLMTYNNVTDRIWEYTNAGWIVPVTIPFFPYLQSYSVELEYPAFVHPKIALMMLSKVGINLRDSDLIQYSEMQNQK